MFPKTDFSKSLKSLPSSKPWISNPVPILAMNSRGLCQAPLQKQLQLCKILLRLSCSVPLLAAPTCTSIIYRSFESSSCGSAHSQLGQLHLFLQWLSDYDPSEQPLNPLTQLQVTLVGNNRASASHVLALCFRAFFPPKDTMLFRGFSESAEIQAVFYIACSQPWFRCK